MKKYAYSFGQWCRNNNHEDYLNLWDYELNNIDPETIAYSSSIKAFFKCPKGIHKSELKWICALTSGTELKCIGCNSIGQWLIDAYGCDAVDKYWSHENNKTAFEIKRRSNKKYIFICQKCGHEYSTTPNNFIVGNRCPICSNHQIVHGINSVADTNPELLMYFVNIEDSYKYSAQSSHTCWFKCPICGFKKKSTIHNISHRGFSCSVCNPTISYPNRLMASLLNLLSIDFETEYIIRPMNYRYDFYIKQFDMIIEMHGLQHYEPTTLIRHTFEEEMLNDKNKFEWAIKNGIKNYIVIDSRYSDLNFIVNNIVNSKLVLFLNLNDIDWEQCDLYASKSYMKDVCDMWESTCYSAHKISDIFNISHKIVLSYIHKGLKYGMCTRPLLKEKPILCLDNNCLFDCSKTCANNSELIFGAKLTQQQLRNVASGKRDNIHGFHFKYISYKEFNEMQQIANFSVFICT